MDQVNRARLGLVLVGIGGLLAVWCGLGVAGTAAGFLLAERLNHPILLGLAAGVLLTAGAVLRLGGAWRAWVILAGAIATFAWTGHAALQNVFAPADAGVRYEVVNADGSLRAHVLLTGIVDPVYLVRIEQTDRGALDRFFVAGCIDGDALDLGSLRWDGDQLVALTDLGDLAMQVSGNGHVRSWHLVEGTGGSPSEGYASLDDC